MLSTVMMGEQHRSSRNTGHASPRHEQETLFSLAGKRAVIVEDEGITQLQLRRILQSERVEVVGLAANGRDAVQIVLETKPDLVLMDIRMPIMDGLEAARRILEQYRVCIVMLTAFSDDEYRQQAEDIGTCGYIVNPVTATMLVPELASALQKFSQS